MRKNLWSLMVLALLLALAQPAAAQKNLARVQEFTGMVSDRAEVALFALPNLQAGQTLYVYLEATSGSLDTYLGLGSADFAQVFREDDDGGGDYNSALEYPVTVTGDYALAVTRYDDSTSGGFRLVVGLDAPDALTGRARPTGEPFVVPGGTAARADIPLNGMGVSFTDCSILEDRPVLSGPEQTLPTRFFILHYTRSGADAVTDGYASDVAGVLDVVWKREINEFGWPAPPNDCGEGGDDRYDVYLMDAMGEGDMLGYTDPQALLGDNPSSDLVEGWASYSYLVIENDFEGDHQTDALMRATAAHEFHHAIQFGYDLNDIGGHWYYEATATWMETQVFPQYQDATPYISDLFDSLDLCVGANPEDDAHSLRIYGEWLLMDSLAQDYGPGVVQRLWELIADHEGMESFYLLAEELNTTPQRIIQRYAIRNLLQDYALAADFPARVRVESLVSGPGEVMPRQSGIEQLGVDYVLVTQPGTYTFEIEKPNLTMTAVGVNTKTYEANVFEMGKRGTLDTTPYQYTYLILMNVDRHADPDACTVTDWTLTVRDGRDDPLLAVDPKRWPALNFVPAR